MKIMRIKKGFVEISSKSGLAGHESKADWSTKILIPFILQILWKKNSQKYCSSISMDISLDSTKKTFLKKVPSVWNQVLSRI